MTSKLTSDERLVKILSETQATIMEHNSRCVRGSVEVDARLFESMIMELQERRKADSEPVAEVLSNRQGNDTSTIDRALPVGTQLYRHAQPVVPPMQHWEELCREYPDMSIGDAIIRAAWWNHCRAAMLQHQPQNAQQNTPENIPGGLVEAVNNLLNNDGSRGCYDAMECGTAREKIELWLAQRQRWEEQRKANLSAGNSPVIPDGYRLQPISEYEAMCATVNSDEWPQRWIPVSEQMPGSQEWVIVFAKWANQQVLCWDDVQNRWTDFEDQSYYADMFSHWMPLPAAPQEARGDINALIPLVSRNEQEVK